MFDAATIQRRARSELTKSLPEWAILADTGMGDAPTVGIGARVSGFDIWACAASAARETKEMLADWGRCERRPSQLPLFEGAGGGA